MNNSLVFFSPWQASNIRQEIVNILKIRQIRNSAGENEKLMEIIYKKNSAYSL